MEIDLEVKSKELKEFVSQYETASFLGNISLMMQFIGSSKPMGSLQGLSSPQRQLYYVSALNITSAEDKGTKGQFSQNEWDEIKGRLIEIEMGYQQFFYPKKPDEIDEDWKAKRRVAIPTFLSYFNQGHLNYEEQVIDRVIKYFTSFNTQIKANFGVSVEEFLDIYNFIDALPNEFLKKNINPKEGEETWKQFATRMGNEGIMPDRWNEFMPQHFAEVFDFMQDKGKMYRFSFQQLADKFGDNLTTAFINSLTSSRNENPFLYYTEINPLTIKPLFQVKENVYQILETKQLIHSIYNLLFQFCINEDALKNKWFAVRGDELEIKIENLFQSYFNSKAVIYKGYYTQAKHEQDLLVLINGTAFIIEAKSSKRKEPRRDPDKAYDLILNNFDETIQKGYDQAYRVKEIFLNGDILKIYSDQALTKHVVDINTKKYYNVFSLIVTLETFGQIQTDLTELLEIWDDDEFPWSICIDDLETFLLVLKKKNFSLAQLVQFLKTREKLHGHLICSDELEICGGYLSNRITKKIADADEIILTNPDLSSIFDSFYHKGGLGFENEKNMHIKTDSKYFVIGSDVIDNKR